MSPPFTAAQGPTHCNQTKMDQGKEPEKTDIVEWASLDDPDHPQNLSKPMKWFVTLTYGLMTFVVTFASSVFSTANEATSAEFHVSTEVMTLATALTVLVRSEHDVGLARLKI